MIDRKHRTLGLFACIACFWIGACGGRSEQLQGRGTSNDPGGGDATGGSVNATGGSVNATGGDGPAASGGSGAVTTTGGGAGTSGAPAAGTAGMPAGGAAGASAGMSGSAGAVDCRAAHDELDVAYDDARVCDPTAAEDPCTASVIPPTGCRTPFYFNAANTDAIARFTAAEQVIAGHCAGSVAGACAVVVRGRCNPLTSLCEGVPSGSGRNCEVSGVVYASGENNIYDPWSCNYCSCNDGQLACELGGEGCAQPSCPDGQVVGTGCAACSNAGVGTPSGPVRLCQTVAYGCFLPCTAGCADPNPVCEDGVCVPGACSIMNP